jgi:peptidoglycan hydrolase CwlO-like protein
MELQEKIEMYQAEIQKAQEIIQKANGEINNAQAVALRCEGAIAVLQEMLKEEE